MAYIVRNTFVEPVEDDVIDAWPRRSVSLNSRAATESELHRLQSFINDQVRLSFKVFFVKYNLASAASFSNLPCHADATLLAFLARRLNISRRDVELSSRFFMNGCEMKGVRVLKARQCHNRVVTWIYTPDVPAAAALSPEEAGTANAKVGTVVTLSLQDALPVNAENGAESSTKPASSEVADKH